MRIDLFSETFKTTRTQVSVKNVLILSNQVKINFTCKVFARYKIKNGLKTGFVRGNM